MIAVVIMLLLSALPVWAGSPAQSGFVRDINGNTSVSARNAANTGDIPEIGTAIDNSVHLGGVGASSLNFDDPSTVNQGSMTSGAFVDVPARDPNFLGSTINCSNSWYVYNITSNSTITFNCPTTTNLQTMFIKVVQPASGSTFTPSFATSNGSTIFTPLGGALPSCTQNNCFDIYRVQLDGAQGMSYTISLVNSYTPLTNSGVVCGGSPCFYIDSVNGSNSNNGTTINTPWQDLTNVQSHLNGGVTAGTWFLFKAGSTFLWSGTVNAPMINIPSGTNGTAVNPIVFTTYSNGAAPIFDGNNGRAEACFWATYSATPALTTPVFSYITINGFECKHTGSTGVLFTQTTTSQGTAGMPGIVIQNMNIHNLGNGCSSTTGNCSTGVDSAPPAGACPGYPGCNMIQFMDQASWVGGGAKYLNNSVHDAGGHNLIQIDGDIQGPVMSGNFCFNFDHNCMDIKRAFNAMVTNNTCFQQTGAGSACYYFENSSPTTGTSATNITWQGNVAYTVGGIHLSNGFQCESGQAEGQSGTTYNSNCHLYNNTFYGQDTTSCVVSASSVGVSWDVRNNICDTSAPLFVCNAQSTNTCGDITTWDYNGNGGITAGAPVVSTLVGMSGKGAHDLNNVNPLYISAPSNLHLSVGSSYINAGQAGLTTGNTNIGAY